MKILQHTGHIPLAGSEQCPSTQRRLRCPKCYALLPMYLWQGTRAQCPQCSFKLRITHNEKGAWSYFLTTRKDRTILWGLFYAFVWMPVMWLDHYLKLHRLLLFAVLRLMS